MKIRTRKKLKDKVKRLISSAAQNCCAVFKNYRHDICILITIAFILVSVFCFGTSFTRLSESLNDIKNSWRYMLNDEVTPTVNNLSSVGLSDLGLIPQNLELFIIKLKLYGKLLLTVTNLKQYGYILFKILLNVTYIVLYGSMPVIVVILMIKFAMTRQNTKRGDTKPLQLVRKIAGVTYIPIKTWCNQFILFVKEHRFHWGIWLIIWLLNFNAFTILFEIIAYYFYFIASFDLIHLYVQLYKLLLDLSVALIFIPKLLWFVIALIVYDTCRRRHAMNALNKIEAAGEEMVQNLPIATLISGSMGTKKTTFLTEISITANKLFRDVALKKIIENDMYFPNFPWINLEDCIKYGIARHSIYNLATCKEFIQLIKKWYHNEIRTQNKALVWRLLEQRYGYKYDNMIFGYDVERYGYSIYDNLEVKTIFDIIENYAQLYLIYIISSSLLIANLSIRIDDVLNDIGNFPLWDNDFFRHDGEFMKNNSHYAHILDQEALRLGKHLVNNSRFKDSIDFGIIAITEIGKERGNQKTQTGKASDNSANPNNDLLEQDLKLCRHRATVDNFPFVLFVADENRAASLYADMKELFDLLYMYKSSDFKMTSPLFALDELLYMGARKVLEKYYVNDRYNKGRNSLLRQTIKISCHKLYWHYLKLFNLYSVSTLEFSVQDGREKEEAKRKKHKLSKAKIHAGRFATDAYSQFYYEKTRRSKVGIGDIPEYGGKTASLIEIESQHSYLGAKLYKVFIENDVT